MNSMLRTMVITALLLVITVSSLYILLQLPRLRAHHRFVEQVKVGQHEDQLHHLVGPAKRVWEGDQRNEVFGLIGGYYHEKWSGIGKWPLHFWKAELYRPVYDLGEVVFFDDKGCVICLLSLTT